MEENSELHVKVTMLEFHHWRVHVAESSLSWPNGKQKSQLGRTMMA